MVDEERENEGVGKVVRMEVKVVAIKSTWVSTSDGNQFVMDIISPNPPFSSAIFDAGFEVS